MPFTVPQISYSNTYGHFIAMVNSMANAMSTIVVTTNGIPTVGNTVVHGSATSNTVSTEQITPLVANGSINFNNANVAINSTSNLTIAAANTTVSSPTTFTTVGLLRINTTPTDNKQKYLSVNAINKQVQYDSVSLSVLIDTNIVAPTNGQYLRYNETASKWENQAFPGTLANLHVTSFSANTITGNTAFTGGVTVTGNVGWDVNQVLYVVPNASASLRRVGIKVSNPQGTLHVDGNGLFTGDVDFRYTSDKRLKELIKSAPGLSAVNCIRGWQFQWNEKANTDYTGNKTGQIDLGVLAQDVEMVIPEAVSARPDGTLSVDYIKLIPVLINAVNELSSKVAVLEKALYGNKD